MTSRCRAIRAAVSIFSLLSMLTPFQSISARQGDDARYDDPASRFSVPVPTNWTVEERDGFAVLQDPDGDLAVTLIVVPGSSAEDAAGEALPAAGVSLDGFPRAPEVQELPSERGVDETVVVTYLATDQQSFVQVIAQRVGDQVFVMIFTGTLEAAQRRNSQLQIIANGFAITSLDSTDLSGAQRLPLTATLLAEIEAYVDDLLARLEVPGASVAIVEDGKVVFAQGFGVTENGGTDPVTADTQMMIGSTTKSMTTMLMATEVDDGLLTWDQPVVEILPEFAVADPELTETMTVRNLVCACTGVPRRDLEFFFNASEMSAEDVIASLRTFEFFTEFGEAFQYSNQMVATGGYVAAAAAGGMYGDLFAAYLDAMQARVFDPIGMPDTTFSFEAVAEGDQAASPHGVAITGEYVSIPVGLEETLKPVAPAGMVWSTANDMARYLTTLLQRGVGPDGNRVVSEANLAETWVPQVAVVAETDYGLGWLIHDFHEVPVISHDGNTLGFSSQLAFLPDEGVGIVVLANGQAANLFTEGIGYRLLELMYGLPSSFDTEIEFFLEESGKAVEAMRAQIDDVPEGVLELALGSYRNDVLGDVELSREGSALILDAGEFSAELKYVPGASGDGDFTFVAAEPPLTGTPFVLRIGAGDSRELELDIGTDQYVFRATGSATPISVPGDATPVAA